MNKTQKYSARHFRLIQKWPKVIRHAKHQYWESFFNNNNNIIIINKKTRNLTAVADTCNKYIDLTFISCFQFWTMIVIKYITSAAILVKIIPNRNHGPSLWVIMLSSDLSQNLARHAQTASIVILQPHILMYIPSWSDKFLCTFSVDPVATWKNERTREQLLPHLKNKVEESNTYHPCRNEEISR